MAITSAIVKTRLDAAPWSVKDKEAQAIINGAVPAELKGLDGGAVLRLYEALYREPPQNFSSEARAAMKLLAAETQFQKVATPDFPVQMVKAARPGHSIIQADLTPQMMKRLYIAERMRFSLLERVDIDWGTLGCGQVSQPAYMHVREVAHFGAELERYFTHVYLSRMVNLEFDKPCGTSKFNMTTYQVRIPGSYAEVWRDIPMEDFVVAAYLAIRIQSATKPGRSTKDVLRFAVALYHGMSDMVRAAQAEAGNEVDWAPIELKLISAGYAHDVRYVHEVVK